MRIALAVGFPLVLAWLGSATAGSAWAPEERAPDNASESAVFAAVFRQQIQEHLDAAARDSGTVICLGVNPGGAPQAPAPEIMGRFARDRAVRRASECDPRPSGAVEAMTLKPAVVVTAGPIEWIAADEAWVTVTYFRSRSLSAERRYRVVRDPAGWFSLGPILRDGPLRLPNR